MAFLTLEDIYESVEVVVFPNTYAQCEEILSLNRSDYRPGNSAKGRTGSENHR